MKNWWVMVDFLTLIDLSWATEEFCLRAKKDRKGSEKYR
jgi:hypothetical protein